MCLNEEYCIKLTKIYCCPCYFDSLVLSLNVKDCQNKILDQIVTLNEQLHFTIHVFVYCMFLFKLACLMRLILCQNTYINYCHVKIRITSLG